MYRKREELHIEEKGSVSVWLWKIGTGRGEVQCRKGMEAHFKEEERNGPVVGGEKEDCNAQCTCRRDRGTIYIKKRVGIDRRQISDQNLVSVFPVLNHSSDKEN